MNSGTGVVGLDASYESLTLTNSGAVAETGNGLTGDTIAGTGGTIYVGANTTATLSGPENAVKITQSGDNLTVDGSDTIYLSGAVSGTFGGTWSDGTFSGVYSGGGLNTAAVDYNDGYDGYKDDFAYDYNSSGYTSELYSPGGSQPVWTGDYSPSNILESSTSTYTDGDGTYGYGGDVGDDDFGDLDLASSPSLAGPPGTNVGVIVNADLAVGDPAAAEAAETAGLQAYLAYQVTGAVPQATSMFEGPAWDSNVITWSVATTPGSASSPFSSYMTAGETPLVSQAFQAWGAASGLTFEEVPDSALSDIRIGWGTFDTADSGVLGYTSFQAQSGQIQPNAMVRLEDPSEDALVTNPDGNLSYSGTNAELYQVLLHEIGHAIGLADNSGPNSVMYAAAGASNRSLDGTDIAGAQTLFSLTQTPMQSPAVSSGDASVATLHQLIQAMATVQIEPALNTPSNPVPLTTLPPWTFRCSRNCIDLKQLVATPYSGAAHAAR
jgi:hypothetical protein